MGPWQERYIWVCPVCLGDNVFDIAGVQEVSDNPSTEFSAVTWVCSHQGLGVL